MIIPSTTPDSPTKRMDSPLPNPVEQSKSIIAGSPPPYVPSNPSSSSTSRLALPPLKPSNYISILEKNHSARGTFIIDPSLAIPSEYLPPLPEGESEDTRSNLHCKSHNGSVSADVYLLDKLVIEPRKKVILNTISLNGSVSNIIHREGSYPPFSLTSSSRDGSVSVKLPRSYQGSLTASTKDGRVRMSPAVSAQATVFSTVNGTQKAYIGDLSVRKNDTDDVVLLETRDGNITIQYEDEMPTTGGLAGFFNSLFQ
ncbi:hypothetical protein BT96DRAFT_856813 [Gymnopus androsaceus JB14]|uniref:DUF7330 domain-containing protein n=1 Tax=Gymnopus androsaceus JB14 TaxID=1447944 RepID=A0A6A4HT25_9AGAR|nr:hypothetical protein BT96DRAFT_856813 [Gymnopus androsaceus JB14]